MQAVGSGTPTLVGRKRGGEKTHIPGGKSNCRAEKGDRGEKGEPDPANPEERNQPVEPCGRAGSWCASPGKPERKRAYDPRETKR